MIKNFFAKHKSIIALFLSVKIGLIALIFLTYPLLRFSSYDYQLNGYRFTAENGMVEKHMAAWDGQWYLHIAEQGYRNFPTAEIQAKSYAFFPMYPLLIRIVSFFTLGNTILAALLIAFGSSFVYVIILYKLIMLEYAERIAKYAVLYFLITPSAIFFTAAYAEALFFMLVLAAWYCARTGRWRAGALFAYCAALTRPQGAFLVLPLAIEYALNARKSIYSLLGAPLGLLTYYTFLYFETGNFFTHTIINQKFWGRTGSDFFEIASIVIDRVSNFASLPFNSFHYSQLDTAILVSSLALIVPMIARLRLSYALWAFILIALPLSTGITTSITRYISLSFPHYLFLSLLGARYRALHWIFVIVFSVIGAVLAVRFVHWYWAG